MLIKKFKKIPTSKRQYTINKIKLTPSLGYREDPYLSNWLSFKTPEEAAQALTSEYGHTQESARRFFMHRIEKKQDLALIALLAEQTFTAPEKELDLGHTKESVLQIFIALAKEDYIHDTALQAAATGMLTARGWGHISGEARNLFEILFQKKHPQAFEVAIQTATDTFLDQDWRTRHDGLQLFRILFNYGKGFKEATEIAEHISPYEDWETKKSALQLLQALVEKNQAFNLAEKIAMQQIKDFTIPSVQAQAFLLLIYLVEKNQAIESAIHAINFTSYSNQCLEDNPKLFCDELKSLCLEKTKTSDENTNIPPSRCTSKALMCLPDSEQPQKKKRRLEDELKYPHGQEMGGDKLAYSITAKEFAAGLAELELQHRSNDDKCGRE